MNVLRHFESIQYMEVYQMAESNFDRFSVLVKDFLKTDNKYKLQIENFQNYLVEYALTDRVFNLYESNIDDFFKK